MMALTAAKASAPAITSFGLCSKIRIARPRSASAAIALAPRRRRGMSSSLEVRLGTFLHLMSLVFMNWILDFRPQRRGERRDVAGGLRELRHERQRQRDHNGGSFVNLALHGHFAAMQPDQAFHDRQPEAGAFMPPLVGLAGLEERMADPLEILRGDADAGVGDAKDQPRSFDMSRHRHGAAAFGG